MIIETWFLFSQGGGWPPFYLYLPERCEISICCSLTFLQVYVGMLWICVAFLGLMHAYYLFFLPDIIFYIFKAIRAFEGGFVKTTYSTQDLCLKVQILMVYVTKNWFEWFSSNIVLRRNTTFSHKSQLLFNQTIGLKICVFCFDYLVHTKTSSYQVWSLFMCTSQSPE